LRRPLSSTLFPYTTLFRSVRHALRRVVGRQGSVLYARRKEQIVLHAGIVQRPESLAVSQSGQRNLRERHEGGGAVRYLVERPGRDRKSTRLNSSHLGISYA